MKNYDEKHYCLEGIQHEKLCDCNCSSCEAIKHRTKQERFNDVLNKAIEKSDPNYFINYITKFFRDNL